MKQKIICFCGQIAAGKDEAADQIADKLNHPYQIWCRAAFGNNVKKVYMDAFGVDREFVEKWKRKPDPPPGFDKNIRESLMFIGDGFRQMNPGVWIEWLFRDYPTDNLVISDGRYHSECKEVSRRGGINVAVWRPGYENDIEHPSESQLKPEIDRLIAEQGESGPIKLKGSPFDWFVVNKNGLSDLFQVVEKELIPYLEKIHDKGNL